MAYVKGEHDAIPAIRMMRLSQEDIGKRAEVVAGKAQSSKAFGRK